MDAGHMQRAGVQYKTCRQVSSDTPSKEGWPFGFAGRWQAGRKLAVRAHQVTGDGVLLVCMQAVLRHTQRKTPGTHTCTHALAALTLMGR